MKKTVTAQDLPRDNYVTGGMSDIDAGDALARYIEAAGGDDIDVFDAEAGAPEAKKRASGSVPSAEEATTGEVEDDESSDEAVAGDAADGVDPEVSEDEETEDDENSDDADAEEGLEVATLAAALGVDESLIAVGEDGEVKVRYKVDGEAGEATLQELVKGYQLEAHTTRKSQQLTQERQALREHTAQQEQQLATAIQQAGAFGEVMRGRVLARYEKVPWDKLREEDPGEYSALYTQMQQEMQSINYEVENLQTMASTQLGQAQARHQAQHEEWVAEEQRKLYEAMPDLQDPEKRMPLLQDYQSYLLGHGFTAPEIQGILDHRMMRVIHDATQHYKATKANGKAPKVPVEKRLRKVPKVMKAGSPSTGKARKTTNRTKSLRQLGKSGSDIDAARFAIESGIVDSML